MSVACYDYCVVVCWMPLVVAVINARVRTAKYMRVASIYGRIKQDKWFWKNLCIMQTTYETSCHSDLPRNLNVDNQVAKLKRMYRMFGTCHVSQFSTEYMLKICCKVVPCYSLNK